MNKGTCTDIPLVIDLDGSLIQTDLLVESLLSYLKRNPLGLLRVLKWFIEGKYTLKEKLADITNPDATSLPYNKKVLQLIRNKRREGKKIILATASHRKLADMIAQHLKVFDAVWASENGINLSSANKRDLLVGKYGERGYDYLGDSYKDFPVWASARKAYAVNPGAGIRRRARALPNFETPIMNGGATIRNWLRALRVHQWVKNLLVFVPLVASHALDQPDLIMQAGAGFLLFGLCASGVYILNDLIDLEDDRNHPEKCNRPFAAGDLPVISGIFICPLLLAASLGLAYVFLSWGFFLALATYFGITLIYSLALKRVIVLDVIILAILYTLRIIAGAFVLGFLPTFWMLAFSMFIFLSLALLKRYSELLEARKAGNSEQTPGRGYYPEDLEAILALGATSGYLSVLVLALYIQDKGTVSLYTYPEVIWFACPLLLLWVSRFWLLAHRGIVHVDPVVFAIKDRVSLLIGGAFGAVFWLAS